MAFSGFLFSASTTKCCYVDGINIGVVGVGIVFIVCSLK